MKAMILAAGRGERMRPLTDRVPKPLLRAAGKPLIQYHVENLVAAGFEEIVVNTAWLGEQLESFLGDGARWNCAIHYSREEVALETAGGIMRALPLLGTEAFAVVNGDIWTDFPLGRLPEIPLPAPLCASLVMVDNPPQHPGGDFVLDTGGMLRRRESGETGLTYAGIGVYHPDFFGLASGTKLALRPLLDAALERRTVAGLHFQGRWCDLATPQRLAELDAALGIL